MAGRPSIYNSQAERQAAYRNRKAGYIVKLDEETFEQTISTLKHLVREADLPRDVKTNLGALTNAMASKDGYTWWKLERQRMG